MKNLCGKVRRYVRAVPPKKLLIHLIWLLLIGLVYLVGSQEVMAAGIDLPSGDDGASQMTAAATILRLADTALFKWISRFLSAVAIWGVAISIKDMRYGSAFLSLLAAFLFAAAPSLVSNIFEVSGGSTLFN